MNIQAMKELKQELGVSNQKLSELTGLPVSTLQRVFSGTTKAPRMDTLQAIEKALLTIAPYDRGEEEPTAALRESGTAWREKKQGEYTIEDYYALPDERRVELIDGVIYDMSAPSALHQAILGDLHLQFRACSDAHEGDCEVFLSPCDVRLDCDNRTMLQPDLFVICRKLDWEARAIDGAPDLIVEILSPSTRKKDMTLKLEKYCNAGVKEYWIVDPKKEVVMVHNFADPDYIPTIFSFDDRIPIQLSGGECEIDFKKIHDRIIARS